MDIFSVIDADACVEVFLFFVKYGLAIGYITATLCDLTAYGVFKALGFFNITKG